VQAGRPYPSTISELKSRTLPNDTEYYNEAHFCAANSFYWADVETKEGFPITGLHEDSVDTPLGDNISGIASNKGSLFVFKDRSMALITGEVGLNNIHKEILETDIGCAAHATIKNVNGMLVFLDAIDGFQAVVAGQLPTSVGIKINPLFKNNPVSGEAKLNLKRAVAENHELGDMYICYLPAESLSGTTRYPNDNSKIVVYDYSEVEPGKFRNGWHLWSGLNMQGGIVVKNDELFWTERKLSSGSMTYNHWKQSKIGNEWDYEDHDQAISWQNFTAWLHYGIPSIDKKFIKGLVNSARPTQGSGFTLTVEQYGNFIDTLLLSSADIEFNFDSSAIKRSQIFALPESKLISLALKFKNSEHQTNVAITGWEVEVESEYGMEIGA
jgi:hypothetical protein